MLTGTLDLSQQLKIGPKLREVFILLLATLEKSHTISKTTIVFLDVVLDCCEYVIDRSIDAIVVHPTLDYLFVDMIEAW